MAELLSTSPGDIERAGRALREGLLVAFPTETVYGLGAKATDTHALARVFEAKRRPTFDPLIVHIAEVDALATVADLSQLAADRRELVQRLISALWPGPLTLILPKQPSIPDLATSGLSTAAVRLPAHPVAQALIRAAGVPVAAPSANPFGYISPTMAEHVAEMLKDKIELILDGGKSVFGIESTIVSMKNDDVFIHRHGAISKEEISEAVGDVYDVKDKGICESPGSLPYHYSPHKPLKIINSPLEIETDNSCLLAFKSPSIRVISRYVRVLSEKGDLREAATNFFSYLIELDKKDVDLIYAEKISEKGLGRAMMERLKKASKKHRYITL